MSDTLKPFIETLIAGDRHLTSTETHQAFTSILSPTTSDPHQIAALLTLLRARGETPDEITGMIRAMNDACHAVSIPGSPKLLDIVGTGGDGADTINISTASVVLAAACGCIVAKAGNRSVSSACGSADVLEKIGVKVDLAPDAVVQCVEQCGVAFMFAPVNHPAMKSVAPVRKALGVRTCFNILGPMTNAAGAQRAVVIHGVGLDEISPLGPATILEIKNTAPPGETKTYTEKTYTFDPLTISIPRCTLPDLRGGGPSENAISFRQVLLGGDHTDAKRDSIVLNAGVGNYVYGKSESIEDGCKLAREVLVSGGAERKLEEWIRCSKELDD